MEAAIATVVPSSFGFSRATNFRSRSTVFNVNGYLNLKSHSRSGHRKMASGWKEKTMVRASATADNDSYESAAPIAPLILESPIGQFLTEILISHPHLVPAAVERQLEQLQTDRDAEGHKQESSASGIELLLYRRIAKVKANERKKALEEILYVLVVQKFVDANVSLIPRMSPSSLGSSDRVDNWPSLDRELEELHSPEANEMIQNHLAFILGSRFDDSTSVAKMSKLRVGQVYAASVMYGYFLKRVDERFQLEKTMKILPDALDGDKGYVEEAMKMSPFGSDVSVQSVESQPEVSCWAGGLTIGSFGHWKKPSSLGSYVKSIDAETLMRYTTIRTMEAVSIIQKHTQALFGRRDVAIIPNSTRRILDSSEDELIKMSFGGLKRLVLEALTFGSFLWDVESFVDSR
ncbi:hypothetical protein PVL29_019410 [Vitis rotundifolia]|uniref:UV-B-induced protein At3g17800, chloroplastic n=1 Tax=Vitis rotundifolia TaxID=103349 RepID=A0AA38Z184_VITRO|nr:hypothetical protein PVL29_019410 [Vitis rotundifolia]